MICFCSSKLLIWRKCKSLLFLNFSTRANKLASFNPLSAKSRKWSNTLKTICLSEFDQANCLGVFDHFVGLAFKGLISIKIYQMEPFTKRFFVLPKYLHMNLTLIDVSICKAAIRVHFLFPSQQVRNHYYLYIYITLYI